MIAPTVVPRVRRWSVAIAVLGGVGLFGTASPAEIAARAQAIVRAYAERVEREIGPVRYVPTVRVLNTPALAYFDARTRRITLPYWPTLDAEVQAFFTSLLADPAEAEFLFGELFGWFLVAHEMTHWLQDELGIALDRYADEQMANEFAVAFVVAEGDEARLLSLGELLVRAVQNLADPVPPGEDRAGYFNERYAELALDPAQYGHYQFTFILDAIARRVDLAFAALLRDLR